MATGRSPASGSSRRPNGGRGGPRRSTRSARELALRVVRRVEEHGAFSNLALSSELARSHLPRADRDLASELARGTLRRRLSLHFALQGVLDRPIRRVSPDALATLELGAYQLLFTRIPPHAAVAETVALATGPAKGFVNAVLRRLSRRPPSWPEGSGDEDVSVRTGLAPWAVRELRRLLPREEVEPAAAALGSPPPLSLRVNRCRTSVEQLERTLRTRGLEPARGRHDPHVLTLHGGDPARLPGFAEGWFAVQDEASAVVAAALDPRPGERVLDACAGPGGKAGDVACRVAPDGVAIASDVNQRRARLVAEAARRLGARVLTLVQDARRPAVAEGFDRVLVDAPCSGLGSARRRPELLWRPSRAELSGLARLQVAILSGVSDLVRPGGVLLYSVCTFPRAETDAAADAFLHKRPRFREDPFDGPDGPAARVRLWPHRHGTDAMFIARFRRES